LIFFGDLAGLAETAAFKAWLTPFRKSEWVVYAKPPFGGPEAVLAYLSRYTHRVAISNNRLISVDAETVAFRWKDYRIKVGDRQRVMRNPGISHSRALMSISFHCAPRASPERVAVRMRNSRVRAETSSRTDR
jgi:Putative transposase